MRLHPLASVLASALAASVFPVLVLAQTSAPPADGAAHGSVAISQDALRSRARANLDRAAAFVAMARQAPAAAADPANAHQATQLAHQSAADYHVAMVDFAKGSYQSASDATRHSIGMAQAAIAAASASAPARTVATPPATAVAATGVVETESGGDIASDAAADLTPESAPAPVVRSRYHGPGPDAPPRPANWRVLGSVPFGAAPVLGLQPNAAAYGTATPFGIVTPVQQPLFQPAG